MSKGHRRLALPSCCLDFAYRAETAGLNRHVERPPVLKRAPPPHTRGRRPGQATHQPREGWRVAACQALCNAVFGGTARSLRGPLRAGPLRHPPQRTTYAAVSKTPHHASRPSLRPPNAALGAHARMYPAVAARAAGPSQHWNPRRGLTPPAPATRSPQRLEPRTKRPARKMGRRAAACLPLPSACRSPSGASAGAGC